jgi:TolB protein
VFQRNCDGSGIWAIDPDASHLRRITPLGYGAVEPAWSPDGSQIAFISVNDPGPYAVTVMSADGSGIHSPNAVRALDRNPTWSPDGRQIAFESRRTGTAIQIAVMNADGSGLHEIPRFAVQPAWSPNGRSFAVSTTNGVGGTRIEVMGVDGSDNRPVTTSTVGVVDQFPSWSPDSRRLAFARYFGEGAIHIVDADGRNLRRLTQFVSGFDDAPSWSPDGQQLVFSHDPGGSGTYSHLYIINADGTDLRPLTYEDCDDTQPSW